MASTRAPAVAEVLWELKRADKLATYCNIATRAGFSAGANGRAMITCMKTIRRDWPHLQWWRAIRDDRTVLAGEHAEELEEWGATITPSEEDRVLVEFDEETKLMIWNEDGSQELANASDDDSEDNDEGGEEE
ncbi:hypothetical protein [Thalassoglobus polymorphus]|uniref:Methylated-DNA-[protein]-cysteine S-methyltransferase DNA binding domain-containing protein n=1 Tax=Thalassoglobus polymorphus TaxID=2527994 RepID=A0A517QHI2_9PLAN|nr:hypothetical protein [Thalassoglobus polymorphus]QDT31093.1 hypothetical protein Mal48_03240 [Thalassoglobus polymorphus]